MHDISIGRFAISRVVDLDGVPFPAHAIYPDSTLEVIRAEQRRLGSRFIDPASLDLLLSFHCYVVRTGRHTVLVDTCVGNDKNRPTRPAWNRRQGPFLDKLRDVGVAPEDVDFVMCTHLHADHVGWNTRLVEGRWVSTFPNAQYIIAETEYRFWLRQREDHPSTPVTYGSFEDSVLPVVASGQALMVHADHEVEPGLYLESAPGHTPGGVMIHVEDQGAHAVLCGDVLHHPVQCSYPEWSTSFCVDAALSRVTRQRFLQRHVDTGTRVLTAHFQTPTMGRVVRDGAAYGFDFDG